MLKKQNPFTVLGMETTSLQNQFVQMQLSARNHFTLYLLQTNKTNIQHFITFESFKNLLIQKYIIFDISNVYDLFKVFAFWK